MYHASRLGMAGGDYVFIAIQLAEIDWWGTYRNFLKGTNRFIGKMISIELYHVITNNLYHRDGLDRLGQPTATSITKYIIIPLIYNSRR